LQPDQTFVSVVIINSRSMNAVCLEKLRDLDVMPVLFPLEVVLYQNERLLRRATDPVEFPVGAAFLNRRNLYFVDIESRKVPPRLAKKDFGFHYSDVDVAMGAADVFLGADNTTNKLTFGSNLCTGPYDCVLQQNARANTAILSHNRAAADSRARIDSGARMDRRPPVRRFHLR